MRHNGKHEVLHYSKEEIRYPGEYFQGSILYQEYGDLK